MLINGKPRGLSSNLLKIIAAVSMLIDHFGLLFFPKVLIFRIIGRIAFPIFAFTIAEGCEHTKDKLLHFTLIFALGIGCQTVYYFYLHDTHVGILITFSVSVLLIYALQYVKELLFNNKCKLFFKEVAIVVFLILIAIVYLINKIFDIDYGFWGCLTPVFTSLLIKPKSATSYPSYLDSLPVRVLLLGIGLALIASIPDELGIQTYSFLAIPILLLYSGKRGKLNIKWFFYIFYPLHLVLLQLLFPIIY